MSIFTSSGGAAQDQWIGCDNMLGQLFDPGIMGHFGPFSSRAFGNNPTVFPLTSPHSSAPLAPNPSSKTAPSAKRMCHKSQKLSTSAGFEPMVDERSPTDGIKEEILIIIRFLVWEFSWPDFDEGISDRVIADARAAYIKKYPGASLGKLYIYFHIPTNTIYERNHVPLLEWMEDHASHYHSNLCNAIIPFIFRETHGPRNLS